MAGAGLAIGLFALGVTFGTASAKEVERGRAQEEKKVEVKRNEARQTVTREPLMRAIEAIERRENIAFPIPDADGESRKVELARLRKRALDPKVSEAELQTIASEVKSKGGRAGWEQGMLKQLDRIEAGSYRDAVTRTERMKSYIAERGGESEAVATLLGKASGYLAVSELKIVRARTVIVSPELALPAVKALVQSYLRDIVSDVKAANQVLLEVAKAVKGSR